MTLPSFRYHSDHVIEEVFEKTNRVCECCGESKGYLYQLSMFMVEASKDICPWCIKDGSAAKKFQGEFIDTYELEVADIDKNVIDQVRYQTPSYFSWQQPFWHHHCGDACQYQGMAKKEELSHLSGSELKACLDHLGYDKSEWNDVLEDYENDDYTNIHKHQCLHCKLVLYSLDLS